MPDGAYFGYNGGREFKDAKYPNLRSVMAGHSSPMHFMVKSNSGIKSLADLKGKRVALSAPGSTAVFMAESTLEAYGLSKKDYKPMLLSYAEQADALRDGTIDMACVFAGAPASAALDLCTTPVFTFLNVGPEELKKVLKIHPYCKEFAIKAGTYKGQNADVKTFATSSILITYAELEPDLVYPGCQGYSRTYARAEGGPPPGSGVRSCGRARRRGNSPPPRGSEVPDERKVFSKNRFIVELSRQNLSLE